MAITKVANEAQEQVQVPQVYEESQTHTTKSSFTISSLDAEMESMENQIKNIKADIAKLEKKKADALSLK